MGVCRGTYMTLWQIPQIQIELMKTWKCATYLRKKKLVHLESNWVGDVLWIHIKFTCYGQHDPPPYRIFSSFSWVGPYWNVKFFRVTKLTPKTRTHRVLNLWNIIIPSKYVCIEHGTSHSCNFYCDISNVLKIIQFGSDLIWEIVFWTLWTFVKSQFQKWEFIVGIPGSPLLDHVMGVLTLIPSLQERGFFHDVDIVS